MANMQLSTVGIRPEFTRADRYRKAREVIGMEQAESSPADPVRPPAAGVDAASGVMSDPRPTAALEAAVEQFEWFTARGCSSAAAAWWRERCHSHLDGLLDSPAGEPDG